MSDTLTHVLASMKEVKRPQRQFLVAIVAVFMHFVGRATFRNLSRYITFDEKTLSRWFRRDFNFSALNTALLTQAFPKEHLFIAAIDASFIQKSGDKTDGIAKFWNGSQSRAEKGIEISTLAVVDTVGHTAYALDTRQTIDRKDTSRVEQYADQIKTNITYLHSIGVKYLVADGYYSKQKFIETVIECSLNYIGKLRRDADLWWPYAGEYKGRGRKQKYDSKVMFDDDMSKWTSCDAQDDNSEIFTALLHSKSMKRLIRVVLIRPTNSSHNKRRQTLLFSTDIELSAQHIVDYYKLRFQIEFLFRDAKQHTGLTDFQCRHQKSIHTHTNVSMTTLNMIKLEDKKLKNATGPTVISIASWRRRKLNEHLMQRFFAMSKIDPNGKNIRDAFEKLKDYGGIAA